VRKKFTLTLTFTPHSLKREAQFLRLVDKLFQFLAGLPEASYDLKVEEGHQPGPLDD